MSRLDKTNGLTIRRGRVHGAWLVYDGFLYVGGAMIRREAREIARSAVWS